VRRSWTIQGMGAIMRGQIPEIGQQYPVFGRLGEAPFFAAEPSAGSLLWAWDPELDRSATDISNSVEVTAPRRRARNSRAERPVRFSKVEVGDQRAQSAISMTGWKVGSLNPVDRLGGKGYAAPLAGEAMDNGFGCRANRYRAGGAH
jgi:hypothetical protein